MNRKPLWILFAWVLALFPESALRGTTVVELDADTMILRAERIFHGTCRDIHTYRDDQDRIVTRYTFWVTESLKGGTDSLVYFVQPGGEYQGVATVIPGLSSHRIGDEVVLFLGATSPQSTLCFPVGLDQGLYRVSASPVDGQPWVQRSLHGLELVRAPTPPKNAVRLPNQAPLEAFKQAVRSKVAALPQDDRVNDEPR